MLQEALQLCLSGKSLPLSQSVRRKVHSLPFCSKDDNEGLQVAVCGCPPCFNAITHSLAQEESARVSQDEIFFLLNKEAICVVPPALCQSGFHSGYSDIRSILDPTVCFSGDLLRVLQTPLRPVFEPEGVRAVYGGSDGSAVAARNLLGHLSGRLETEAHTRILLRYLPDLGFIVNGEKSMLSPKQDMVFLGLSLDSQRVLRRNKSKVSGHALRSSLWAKMFNPVCVFGYLG